MSKKNQVNAIVSIFVVLLLVNLLINYTPTTIFRSKCERYHNWAWIHAPRDGLVSQINDLSG